MWISTNRKPGVLFLPVARWILLPGHFTVDQIYFHKSMQNHLQTIFFCLNLLTRSVSIKGKLNAQTQQLMLEDEPDAFCCATDLLFYWIFVSQFLPSGLYLCCLSINKTDYRTRCLTKQLWNPLSGSALLPSAQEQQTTHKRRLGTIKVQMMDHQGETWDFWDSLPKAPLPR